MTLPFFYNSSLTDNFMYISPPNYTVNGIFSCTGSGTGTLAIPGYTFSDVLMVIQSYTYNTVSPGWQDNSYKTEYLFFHSTHKRPLLTIGDYTTSAGAGTVNIVYGSINKAFTILGLSEKSLQNNLSVYPNPGQKGSVFVKLRMNAPGVKASISDISGRIIIEEYFCNLSTSEEVIKLNTMSFSPGIYYLKIKAGEFESTKRLIIE